VLRLDAGVSPTQATVERFLYETICAD